MICTAVSFTLEVNQAQPANSQCWEELKQERGLVIQYLHCTWSKPAQNVFWFWTQLCTSVTKSYTFPLFHVIALQQLMKCIFPSILCASSETVWCAHFWFKVYLKANVSYQQQTKFPSGAGTCFHLWSSEARHYRVKGKLLYFGPYKRTILRDPHTALCIQTHRFQN